MANVFVAVFMIFLLVNTTQAACVNLWSHGLRSCATMAVNPDGSLKDALPDMGKATDYSQEARRFSDAQLVDIEYGKFCYFDPQDKDYSCLFESQIPPGIMRSNSLACRHASDFSLFYRLSLGDIHELDGIFDGFDPASLVSSPSLSGVCDASDYRDCASSDLDGDGLGYDCPDDSRSCMEGIPTCSGVSVDDPLCERSSDKEVDITLPDYSFTTSLPDCMNFCIDKDHDGVCSKDSARLPSSYFKKSAPLNDYSWYVSQAIDFYKRAATPPSPGHPNPYYVFVQQLNPPFSVEDVDNDKVKALLKDGFLLYAFDQDDSNPNVGFLSDEVCDLKDDNGDGLVDNIGAKSSQPISAPYLSECSDGIDNDGDGLTDDEDPACHRQGAFTEHADSPCFDRRDNDGDGKCDFDGVCLENGHLVSGTPDSGCLDMYSTSESPACSDGIDNDGDGFPDWPLDPSCRFPSSVSETTQCSDGIDNDGDGGIDAPNVTYSVADFIKRGESKDYVVGDYDFTVHLGRGKDCTPHNYASLVKIDETADDIMDALGLYVSNGHLEFNDNAAKIWAGSILGATAIGAGLGPIGAVIGLVVGVIAAAIRYTTQDCPHISISIRSTDWTNGNFDFRAIDDDSNGFDYSDFSTEDVLAGQKHGIKVFLVRASGLGYENLPSNTFAFFMQLNASAQSHPDSGCFYPWQEREDPACSNGDDDDNDGGIDYGVDPDTGDTFTPDSECIGKSDSTSISFQTLETTVYSDQKRTESYSGGQVSFTYSIDSGAESDGESSSPPPAGPDSEQPSGGPPESPDSEQPSARKTLIVSSPSVFGGFNEQFSFTTLSSRHTFSGNKVDVTVISYDSNQIRVTMSPSQNSKNQIITSLDAFPFLESERSNPCADGIDNDGDGLIDFAGYGDKENINADPGCTSYLDRSEVGPDEEIDSDSPECSDGIDNDGDGLVDFDGAGDPDFKDPQCASEDDNSESVYGVQAIDWSLVFSQQQLPFVAFSSLSSQQSHCIFVPSPDGMVGKAVDADSDSDGFLDDNVTVGGIKCLDCTDCAPNNADIHPGAADNRSDHKDNNCNGLVDEGVDSDSDGSLDAFEPSGCVGQSVSLSDTPEIINADGCFYSVSNDNLPGWSNED